MYREPVRVSVSQPNQNRDIVWLRFIKIANTSQSNQSAHRRAKWAEGGGTKRRRGGTVRLAEGKNFLEPSVFFPMSGGRRPLNQLRVSTSRKRYIAKCFEAPSSPTSLITSGRVYTARKLRNYSRLFKFATLAASRARPDSNLCKNPATREPPVLINMDQFDVHHPGPPSHLRPPW